MTLTSVMQDIKEGTTVCSQSLDAHHCCDFLLLMFVIVTIVQVDNKLTGAPHH